MPEPIRPQRFLSIFAATLLALLIFADAASAQLLKDQEKCLNAANKNAAKIVKAQGKDICACIKNGAKGKLGGQTIEECITSDAKGKVAKAKSKYDDKAGNCDAGFVNLADKEDVKQRAMDKDISLIHWIFGSDLDAAILDAKTNKDDSKCQLAVAKAAKKCQDEKLKAYNKCKKDAIKGKNGPAITSAQELQDRCLGTGAGSIPDPKDKLAKCNQKMLDTINKKCPNLNVFPGCPDPADAAALKLCIDYMIECEVCRYLNAVDGLNRDCDLFDDGVANGSCDGAGVQRDIDGDGHSSTLEVCLESDPDDPNSTPESFAVADVCEDLEDNDGDGLVDGDDPGCSPATIAVENFPPAGLDVFESTLELDAFDLEIPNVGVVQVDFQGVGPVCVQRGAPQPGGGQGRTIPVEILAMDLVGSASIPSIGTVPVLVFEDPERASTGEVTASDPNRDFPADSFFDVFFEIELSDGSTLPGGPPGGPAGDPLRVNNNGLNIIPPFNTPGNPCLNPNHPNPNCYTVAGLPHQHCPEPPDFLDHFKVYEVDDKTVSLPVLLRDQFRDDPNMDLEALDKFANPVRKTLSNGRVFDIFDPLAHLTWYRLADANAPLRAVDIINQFERTGTTLLVGDPTHLLVPTRKERFCPPVKLDHFKCYDVLADPNTVTATNVRLQDQFDDPNEELVAVREPVKFCNPVAKNDEQVLNPEDHLTCYRIVPQISQDRDVNIGDQFDPNQDIRVRENVYLCVPTLKIQFQEVPPEGCGDTFPQCDGSCPNAGEICVNTGTACVCQPEIIPCECGLPCQLDCPDGSQVQGQCVIESGSLPPGECFCTGLCPGQPPLCPPLEQCQLDQCILPCPTGGSVPGLCDVPDPQGCLCSNRAGPLCP